MQKKVIVACGSGIATSHMVAKKIQKLLDARGVDADVRAVENCAFSDEELARIDAICGR